MKLFANSRDNAEEMAEVIAGARNIANVWLMPVSSTKKPNYLRRRRWLKSSRNLPKIIRWTGLSLAPNWRLLTTNN